MKAYTQITEPVEGMGVNFPFQMEDAFSFDRMLPLLWPAVRVYGIHQIFTEKQLKSKAVQLALNWPLYSTNYASMSPYSSIDPNSGGRTWPAFGIVNHKDYNSTTMTKEEDSDVYVWWRDDGKSSEGDGDGTISLPVKASTSSKNTDKDADKEKEKDSNNEEKSKSSDSKSTKKSNSGSARRRLRNRRRNASTLKANE
jgi:hypothetical protein